MTRDVGKEWRSGAAAVLLLQGPCLPGMAARDLEPAYIRCQILKLNQTRPTLHATSNVASVHAQCVSHVHGRKAQTCPGPARQNLEAQMPEHEDSKLEFHSRSTSGQHCVPIDYIQRASPRSAIQWKVAESPTAHAA